MISEVLIVHLAWDPNADEPTAIIEIPAPIGESRTFHLNFEVSPPGSVVRVFALQSVLAPGGPARFSVSAWGYGSHPEEPAATITITSTENAGFLPAVSVTADVWIEPLLGEWEYGVREDSLRFDIVAVHAVMFPGAAGARALFWCPPRTRTFWPNGPFLTTAPPSDDAIDGGYVWDLQDLDHVEIRFWDSATGVTIDAPMATAITHNIFCAGQVLLANGKALVVGGHINASNQVATHIHTYDPGTGWLHVPQYLTVARWYPTLTTLSDGRVLISSGNSGALGVGVFDLVSPYYVYGADTTYEIFNPTTSMLEPIDPNEATFIDAMELGTYPAVFMMPAGSHYPGGAVLAVERNNAWLFQYIPGSGAPIVPFSNRAGVTLGGGGAGGGDVPRLPYVMPTVGSRTYPWYGSTVLLPIHASSPSRTRVLTVGGQNESDELAFDWNPNQLATDTAAIFDFDSTLPLDTQPGWRPTGRLSRRRFMNDATLLPDGTVLITGGARLGYTNENSEAVVETELFDPNSETFRLLADAPTQRRYHSIAMLLDSGMVLKAGSTGTFVNGSIEPQFHGDVFKPGYLWRGPRPIIVTPPPQLLAHGSVFTVEVQTADSGVPRISLLRFGGVTHGNNMDQRCIFLTVTGVSRTAGSDTIVLTLTMPADGSVAPPGHYMLFALDSILVPSRGCFLVIT